MNPHVVIKRPKLDLSDLAQPAGGWLRSRHSPLWRSTGSLCQAECAENSVGDAVSHWKPCLGDPPEVIKNWTSTAAGTFTARDWFHGKTTSKVNVYIHVHRGRGWFWAEMQPFTFSWISDWSTHTRGHTRRSNPGAARLYRGRCLVRWCEFLYIFGDLKILDIFSHNLNESAWLSPLLGEITLYRYTIPIK